MTGDSSAQGAAAAALACPEPGCGQPRTTPGRPKKGWIQVQQAGAAHTPWFCSWHCLSRYAIRCELRDLDEPRTDGGSP